LCHIGTHKERVLKARKNGGKYMAKIQPLQDRVLVRRFESEGKTASGIIIPDTAKEKPQEGEVVAVGSGKVLDNGNVVKPAVKAGDRILFSKYAGTEVHHEGMEYMIMREDDILGIIGK
jgi:chaperonin GroES